MKNIVKVLTFILAATALASCYESAPRHHDAWNDPGYDPLVDPTYDPWADPYQDPWADPWYDPPIDPMHDDPWVDQDIPPDTPPGCTPEGGVTVSFEISGAPMTEPLDLERECTVEWTAMGDSNMFEIGLGCPESPDLVAIYVITITASPEVYVYLPEGSSVLFSYVEEYPWWQNRWFSIRYPEGSLAIAGVDAQSLAPYGLDPYGWYSPLGIWIASGYCPWVPGDCGDQEREAIGVSFEETVATVFDGNEASVGMWGLYSISVETAEVYHNVMCDDFPNEWYKALFVSLPVR